MVPMARLILTWNLSMNRMVGPRVADPQRVKGVECGRRVPQRWKWLTRCDSGESRSVKRFMVPIARLILTWNLSMNCFVTF